MKLQQLDGYRELRDREHVYRLKGHTFAITDIERLTKTSSTVARCVDCLTSFGWESWPMTTECKA